MPDSKLPEQKITRASFLNGKTELSDEDILKILDLPVEKQSKNPEIFTDKSYKELKNNPEELERLANDLKTKPEYLKYHDTYIAKSKLLYQESAVLYNEIPDNHQKYLDTLTSLEKLNSIIKFKSIYKSNSIFIANEKNSQLYKTLNTKQQSSEK